MLTALVVSLIVNVLLLIAVFGLNFECNYWKLQSGRSDRMICEAHDQRGRLQDTIDIQAKRLIDIRKLTQT